MKRIGYSATSCNKPLYCSSSPETPISFTMNEAILWEVQYANKMANEHTVETLKAGVAHVPSRAVLLTVGEKNQSSLATCSLTVFRARLREFVLQCVLPVSFHKLACQTWHELFVSLCCLSEQLFFFLPLYTTSLAIQLQNKHTPNLQTHTHNTHTRQSWKKKGFSPTPPVSTHSNKDNDNT